MVYLVCYLVVVSSSVRDSSTELSVRGYATARILQIKDSSQTNEFTDIVAEWSSAWSSFKFCSQSFFFFSSSSSDSSRCDAFLLVSHAHNDPPLFIIHVHAHSMMMMMVMMIMIMMSSSSSSSTSSSSSSSSSSIWSLFVCAVLFC